LSEIIPASNQSVHNSTPLEPQSTSTTGVDLAPVVISPSQILFRSQVLIYSSMLLFASIAIFPFMLTAFYWPILWLSFVVLLIVAMRSAWLNKHKTPIRLSVIQKIWRLQTAAGEVRVEPCEEILLWDSVIVLSVREILTKRKHRIVALSDSMSAEDWRRLRVWLRMGLKDNV
jgi:hypothetical protein